MITFTEQKFTEQTADLPEKLRALLAQVKSVRGVREVRHWQKDGRRRIYIEFWSQNRFAAESVGSYIDIGSGKPALVAGQFAGPGAQTRHRREEALDRIDVLIADYTEKDESHQ